jgi:hypothetical protein
VKGALKTTKEQLWARVSPALMKRLEMRAEVENLSKNELINKALSLYLTKDLTDESLIMAKLTEMQRVIMFLEKRVDLGQRMQMEWQQYSLMFQPELPVDKQEFALTARRAAERNDEFLDKFRRRLKDSPAMLEALLADFLEDAE